MISSLANVNKMLESKKSKLLDYQKRLLKETRF